jgi:hypothetical protein
MDSAHSRPSKSPLVDDSSRHRFLFVGGLHRSGTSILTRALAEHPAITGFQHTGVPEDEGQHLQSVFSPARAHGGPGLFAFDPTCHLTEDSELVTEANRRSLLRDWSQYWQLDRPVLLEKSPPNIVRTRLLQALFPDAVFVVMVRHPVPVAYATQKWSHTGFASLIQHWIAAHRILAADQEHVDRLIIVRYEQFVQDPQSTLDSIFSSLELEDHSVRHRIDPRGNIRYFRRWERRVNPLWLLQRERIIQKFEPAVREFRYSLRDLHRGVSGSPAHEPLLIADN